MFGPMKLLHSEVLALRSTSAQTAVVRARYRLVALMLSTWAAEPWISQPAIMNASLVVAVSSIVVAAVHPVGRKCTVYVPVTDVLAGR